jgi:hypothetical protein
MEFENNVEKMMFSIIKRRVNHIFAVDFVKYVSK